MVYVLIMAGGIGSRFWPKSRVAKPKQFLEFFEDKSLLRTTVDRITPLVPYERIIISTNADYVSLVREHIPELPEENIIGEPMGKNTAPCIAFAAAMINHRDPEATMVVLPSDHYIRDNDAFINALETCVKCVQEDNKQLITIGIAPTRPETGYGYIQFNDEQYVTIDNQRAYTVKTFAEKPDLQTAIKFLQSGDFLWNSGIFIWNADTILREIKKHLPVLNHQVEILLQDLQTSDGKINQNTLESVYNSCLPVSIDYGIMEKSENVLVLPSHFDWSDLGSWMELHEIQKDRGDADGNILDAEQTLTVNSEDCFVDSVSKKLITLVGLKGIGIIETEDAMLICKLDRSQEVKKAYESLDDKDKNKYR